MSDDVLKKVVTYLRQIEKLVETGDLEQIALEARLARQLCEKGK